MNLLLLRGLSLRLGLLTTPFFAAAQAPPPASAAVGAWLNEEKDGRILVYQCGPRLCGKLVQITPPPGVTGPLLDIHNPDPKLRGQPLLNLVFMQGFRFAGNGVWEGGTIYDARSGKTYSCKMTLAGRNQLDVRGFLGFSLLGRTTTWTRLP